MKIMTITQLQKDPQKANIIKLFKKKEKQWTHDGATHPKLGYVRHLLKRVK